jgi:hypothetical protein
MSAAQAVMTRSERNQAIAEAYNAGINASILAERYSLSVQGIILILRGMGIATRPRNQIISRRFADPAERQKSAERLRARWAIPEMAERMRQASSERMKKRHLARIDLPDHLLPAYWEARKWGAKAAEARAHALKSAQVAA